MNSLVSHKKETAEKRDFESHLKSAFADAVL